MHAIEQTRDEDLLRHAVTHEPVSDCPLLDGNDIRLLPSGADTLAEMFTLLAQAEDHIHLEYYILENLHYRGQTVLELLLEKLARGVRVAIIYDSVGSLGTPDSFFDTLSKAGAQVLEFHPVNPLRKHFVWHLNDRDHRKIMLVDGRTAIIGGVNMSRVYENPPEAGTPPDAAKGYWHDCAVRIRGPVVAQAQSLFLDTWQRHGGDALPPADMFPALDHEGEQVTRIAGSLPHEKQQLYFKGIHAAVQNARHRILITTGYFVPERREWQMLADAARRGVSVDLVLAGYSDVRGALHAARAVYGRLLEAGVRIHELTDGFLHAKAATIDGVWTAIGSSNLDRRSYAFNNEVDAVVLGRDTAADLEALLEGWMQRATQVTLDDWRKRSWHEHVAELSARIWERYM
jgi:cardiolipin synthase